MVIYNLGINVGIRPEYNQTRPFGIAINLFTDMDFPFDSRLIFTCLHIYTLLLATGFANLAANCFRNIFNSLALVGFGFANTADTCSRLANKFLVNA